MLRTLKIEFILNPPLFANACFPSMLRKLWAKSPFDSESLDFLNDHYPTGKGLVPLPSGQRENGNA